MLSSAANAVWISGGVLHVQPGILALAPCISGDWHCSLNTPRTMSGRRLREAVKRVSYWGRSFFRAQHMWNFMFLDPSGFSLASSHLGPWVSCLTDVSFSQLFQTHLHVLTDMQEKWISFPKEANQLSFNSLSQHKLIQLGSRHNWC